MSELTPKEKSLEIYNKFRNENSVMSANIRAKKQAIVCVNEIINLDNFSVEGREYWEQVKQEIENL